MRVREIRRNEICLMVLRISAIMLFSTVPWTCAHAIVKTCFVIMQLIYQ